MKSFRSLPRKCSVPLISTCHQVHIKLPQIKPNTALNNMRLFSLGNRTTINTFTLQSNVLKPQQSLFHRGYSTYKDMTEDQLRAEYEKAMETSSADALKVLRKIVEERPDSHNAADALIVHLLEAEQVDEAIKLCDTQIVANPSRFHPYNNKGEALLRKRQFREALQCFDNADKIGSEPRHMLSMWHNKTRAYMELGEYEAAIAIQLKAIEVDPLSIEAIINITTLYIYLGKKNEAVAAYMAFVDKQKLDPKPVDIDFLFHLSKVACTLDFLPDAISMAETILDTQKNAQKPQDPQVRFTLAKYLWIAKKPQEAMEQLQILMNEKPTEIIFWALAATFDDTGMTEQAISSLTSMKDALQQSEKTLAMIYDIHVRLACNLQKKMQKGPLKDEELKTYTDVLSRLPDLCKTLKLDGRPGLTTNPKIGEVVRLPLVPWFTVS